MKKLIAITLIVGIIITAFAFKSKVVVEGEGDFAIMDVSLTGYNAIVVSYGNGKSETVELKGYGASTKSYTAACLSNGEAMISQLKKFKNQGYELKSVTSVGIFTTYIFEKK